MLTTGELHTRLRVAAGRTAAGHVDTRAAAELLGVSRRTVQRWCAGPLEDPARLPAGRLELVMSATRPSASAVRNEALAAARAREDLRTLGTRRDRAAQRRWAAQGWDQPHLVHHLVHELGPDVVRQVRFARIGSDQADELLRATSSDFVRVPTRFHAIVVVHELLEVVDPWRCLARPHLRQGATHTWLDQAPALDLHALYRQALPTTPQED